MILLKSLEREAQMLLLLLLLLLLLQDEKKNIGQKSKLREVRQRDSQSFFFSF
jgi:hypothetical protein